MFCKFCGNQIDEDSKFCDLCGQKIINPTENNLNIHSTKKLKVNDNSSRKRKYSLIGETVGLLSSLVLCVICIMFSTTANYHSASNSWMHFDIGFTYLCFRSVRHLIAIVSIMLCIIFNIVVLVKPKIISFFSSCIYMLFMAGFFSYLIYNSLGAFFLFIPLFCLMLFSLIFMFVSSTNKN